MRAAVAKRAQASASFCAICDLADHSGRLQMNEGRRTQVVLLDERRLDIIVQPRLQVDELLNIVASHCRLKDPDKQYFGLAFFDEKSVPAALRYVVATIDTATAVGSAAFKCVYHLDWWVYHLDWTERSVRIRFL